MDSNNSVCKFCESESEFCEKECKFSKNKFNDTNNKDSEDSECDDNSDNGEFSDSSIEDEKTMLGDIDNKITLKYIKNGKAARTHIFGLHNFILEHIKIAKDIQKKLSTGYFYVKDTKEHCYNGEHKNKLERILINEYKIPKDKIFIY